MHLDLLQTSHLRHADPRRSGVSRQHLFERARWTRVGKDDKLKGCHAAVLLLQHSCPDPAEPRLLPPLEWPDKHNPRWVNSTDQTNKQAVPCKVLAGTAKESGAAWGSMFSGPHQRKHHSSKRTRWKPDDFTLRLDSHQPCRDVRRAGPPPRSQRSNAALETDVLQHNSIWQLHLLPKTCLTTLKSWNLKSFLIRKEKTLFNSVIF